MYSLNLVVNFGSKIQAGFLDFATMINDFKKGDPAKIFWKYVMNSVGVIENPYLNQSKYLDFLQNTQQFLHFSVKFVVL